MMGDFAQAAEAFAEAGLEVLLLLKLQNVLDDYQTLSKNYYNLYVYQRDFYFNNFQTKGELPFANEQFGIAFYVPDYAGANINNTPSGYFPGATLGMFLSEYSNRLAVLGSTSIQGYWYRFGLRYVPLNTANFQEVSGSYNVDISNTRDDWFSYQFRYEEHRRDVFNERRWANRMGSLSFGVKEAYSVERGLATSFRVFDEATGQLASADATIANGLATYAAYGQMQKAVRQDLGTIPTYQQPYFLTNVIPQQS